MTLAVSSIAAMAKLLFITARSAAGRSSELGVSQSVEKFASIIVGGEEFSIRFAIWDTGDTAYDSTALIDAFEWIADSGSVDIGTTPVPVPQ